MSSARHALLFAVLLVTAGCSGAFGGDTTGTTQTAGSDHQFPPGLTADGLADSDALVTAHTDHLEDESVTLREHRVRRYENGSLHWRANLTLRTAANRTRFRITSDLIGKPLFGESEGRAEVFADGDRVYRSVRTPNTSWTDVLRTAGEDPEKPRNVAPDPTRTDDLYVLLNAFEVNDSANVRISTDDPRRYRVESSTLAYPDLLASHLDLDAVRNASLTAVVTADGLVERHRLEFAGTKNGTPIRGTTALRYSAVGETEVEAPGWYDEVKEQSEMSGTSDEDESSGTTGTTQAS